MFGLVVLVWLSLVWFGSVVFGCLGLKWFELSFVCFVRNIWLGRLVCFAWFSLVCFVWSGWLLWLICFDWLGLVGSI